MAPATPASAGPPPDHLPLADAAARLGVHYMTAYRHVRTGRLPAVKVGGQWFVPSDGLEISRPTGPEVARRLEERFVASDEAGAWAIVESALTGGREPADIHLDLVLPALRSIGDRWERGELDVVDEHRATVIAQRVVARLGPRFVARSPSGGTVVVGTVAGDRHGLVTSIIADLLRGRGHPVVDLGADTPAESFAEVAGQHRDELILVALSCTVRASAEAVPATVAAIRGAAPAAPIALGGSGIDGADHAARLGADHWADDAAGLLELVAGT